jgi:catechol 2,3-dioxygenase
MEIKELGHIVLFVRDLEESERFYSDVLGFRPVSHGRPDQRGVMYRTASERTHHELLLIEVGSTAAPLPAGPRVGLFHFGLRVGDNDEDLRAAADALRHAGVEITATTDHTVTHSLYITDPDGNEIELYIDVPGVNWREGDPEMINTATPLKL